jgi:hypothetical protein
VIVSAANARGAKDEGGGMKDEVRAIRCDRPFFRRGLQRIGNGTNESARQNSFVSEFDVVILPGLSQLAFGWMMMNFILADD